MFNPNFHKDCAFLLIFQFGAVSLILEWAKFKAVQLLSPRLYHRYSQIF